MWSNSALFLMVRVKVKNRWGFTLPVPLGVVDELFEALIDLAWLGEKALKYVPIPQEDGDRNPVSWVKKLSPSGIVSASHCIIKDLRKHKGLYMVDLETGDVQVKVHLK